MSGSRLQIPLSLCFVAFLSVPCARPQDWGWRISPESINIQIGEDRPLQLLDDLAQELKGAVWSVDETALGAIREEDGRVTLRAIAAGKVTVSAALRGEIRFREITILPDDQPVPPHTTSWEMHPIGREIRDLPAVPLVDGPHSFSLEQTPDLKTYLRAVADEILYRLDRDGTLVYRLPLPRNAGPLKDEMVLGNDNLGFATRGGLLVAFNVREGREIWRWDSGTTGLGVVAALADGGCLVQTPAALVQVDGPKTSKVVYEGQAMIDWQGQLFGKHN